MGVSITDGIYDPDDLDVAERLEAQYVRLGTRHAACTWQSCTEANVFALEGHDPDIVCATHSALAAGKKPLEAHHIAGRHNSEVTVDIPVSDHRVVSELQRQWPQSTLTNPDKSPLMAIAAALRGFIDLLRTLLDRLLAGIPEQLERLDERLVEHLGPGWWLAVGWDAP